MTAAVYTLGSCRRPAIRHDNGFLDKFAPRAPTLKDHLIKQWWVGKREFAEAAQKVPFLPHNDLSDALAAYRHFLEGSGSTRRFSYERYVANDASGAQALASLVLDVQLATIELYERHFAGREKASFEFTGSAIAVSSGNVAFPYPATENWQKAIGAHQLWGCAKAMVTLRGEQRDYDVTMTLHAEDMYNFNPGAADIVTGIPDEANGVLEVSGLAKQYLNVAELERRLRWTGRPTGIGAVVAPTAGRERQPSDNRRLRNRT